MKRNIHCLSKHFSQFQILSGFYYQIYIEKCELRSEFLFSSQSFDIFKEFQFTNSKYHNVAGITESERQFSPFRTTWWIGHHTKFFYLHASSLKIYVYRKDFNFYIHGVDWFSFFIRSVEVNFNLNNATMRRHTSPFRNLPLLSSSKKQCCKTSYLFRLLFLQ